MNLAIHIGRKYVCRVKRAEIFKYQKGEMIIHEVHLLNPKLCTLYYYDTRKYEK